MPCITPVLVCCSNIFQYVLGYPASVDVVHWALLIWDLMMSKHALGCRRPWKGAITAGSAVASCWRRWILACAVAGPQLKNPHDEVQTQHFPNPWVRSWLPFKKLWFSVMVDVVSLPSTLAFYVSLLGNGCNQLCMSGSQQHVRAFKMCFST